MFGKMLYKMHMIPFILFYFSFIFLPCSYYLLAWSHEASSTRTSPPASSAWSLVKANDLATSSVLLSPHPTPCCCRRSSSPRSRLRVVTPWCCTTVAWPCHHLRALCHCHSRSITYLFAPPSLHRYGAVCIWYNLCPQFCIQFVESLYNICFVLLYMKVHIRDEVLVISSWLRNGADN